MKTIFPFFVFFAFGPLVESGIPQLNPSVGAVWPRPQSEVSETSFMTVRPENFSFTVTYKTCGILERALARYESLIKPREKKYFSKSYQNTKNFAGNLDTVSIKLLTNCDWLPYLYMDEQYEIKINSPDAPGEGSIISKSIWGMLRGLETFAQLLVLDGGAYRINSTQIRDFPRFPHRGFMIDTSRHFLPVPYIEQMLDLMSINKLNVLHWHIVDSPSFPYQSAVYPDLSLYGAWSPKHIYTADQIAHVIDYAIDRGIRVLPEFDTPGHTDSWGPGQPGLLTKCYTGGVPDGTYGPVDPSNEANYDFLTNLFTEVTSRFPDHYLHLGGDEVPFDCWESNPEILAFMVANGIESYTKLEEYYITRVIDIVSGLPTRNGYLVWQEVFDNGVKLANDTVVHIWKHEGNTVAMNEEVKKVTAAGYQALISSCWYLNYITYGVDWHKYYACDPVGFNGTEAQKQLVMGGEACMWGEYVDRTNLISRSFPRGAVVAEKLWSAATDTTDPDAASPRLEEHRCRMLGRGYSVEPIWPSYCDADIES